MRFPRSRNLAFAVVISGGVFTFLVIAICTYKRSESLDLRDRQDPGLADTVTAMHAYHDFHGRLPAYAILDENKRPILSWRVAILPFLGEDELFREFDFTRPWDSPHNLALLAKMPTAYAPPSGKRSRVPPNQTMVRVFVGRGATFEGDEGHRWTDFADGLGTTIFVIEAGEPIPWTKPEEINYDPDKPLPRLKQLFTGGYRVCLGDTSIRWIDERVSETQVHAAVSRIHNAYFEIGRLGVPIR